MKWYKAESTEIPDEVDTTSSKTTVYLRRNIVEKQRESEFDGKMHTYYEYNEVKLTKEEYQQYLTEINITNIEKQRADIDYIALMTGVDLEE